MTFSVKHSAAILGVILLVVGVVWAVTDAAHPQPQYRARQQTIELPADAFDGDPALQGAVKRLQQGSDVSLPQGSDISAALQPAGSAK